MRMIDEKMRDKPPLLEEPCAQTLSGKIPETVTIIPMPCRMHYGQKAALLPVLKQVIPIADQ